jgi:carbonic anhydrase
MSKVILITCSDSRLHRGGWIVSEVKQAFSLSSDPFLIVLPGPDKGGEWEEALEKGVKVFLGLGPIEIIVVSHEDCKGHPCTSLDHERDTEVLASRLRSLFSGTKVCSGIALLQEDGSWKLRLLEEKALAA